MGYPLLILDDSANAKGHPLVFGDAVGQPPESQNHSDYGRVFPFHGLKVIQGVLLNIR